MSWTGRPPIYVFCFAPSGQQMGGQVTLEEAAKLAGVSRAAVYSGLKRGNEVGPRRIRVVRATAARPPRLASSTRAVDSLVAVFYDLMDVLERDQPKDQTFEDRQDHEQIMSAVNMVKDLVCGCSKDIERYKDCFTTFRLARPTWEERMVMDLAVAASSG